MPHPPLRRMRHLPPSCEWACNHGYSRYTHGPHNGCGVYRFTHGHPTESPPPPPLCLSVCYDPAILRLSPSSSPTTAIRPSLTLLSHPPHPPPLCLSVVVVIVSMREFDSFKTVMAIDAAELRGSDLPKVGGFDTGGPSEADPSHPLSPPSQTMISHRRGLDA